MRMLHVAPGRCVRWSAGAQCRGHESGVRYMCSHAFVSMGSSAAHVVSRGGQVSQPVTQQQRARATVCQQLLAVCLVWQLRLQVRQAAALRGTGYLWPATKCPV